MRALLIGALAISLAGCAIHVELPGSIHTQPADALALTVPIPSAKPPTCPPKVQYTQAQQDTLDKWIGDNPNSPILPFLIDYHKMRVDDDACLSNKN